MRRKKTNISKTAPSSQESLCNVNTGCCFAWGFPSPWKTLAESDQMLWKQVFPCSPGQWNTLGEETLWFGHFDRRRCQWFDFTRDAWPRSSCECQPSKAQIKSPYRSYLRGWCALPFLLRSGRKDCLPSWPACVTGHEPRVPFIAKRN